MSIMMMMNQTVIENDDECELRLNMEEMEEMGFDEYIDQEDKPVSIYFFLKLDASTILIKQ